MHLVEEYYDNLVKPIEEKCCFLNKKINSKNFIDILFKKLYIKKLKFYETILDKYYEQLDKIIKM